MIRSLKIFCDFDGTVCKGDVRSIIFRTFGGNAVREAVDLWMQGKISGDECIRRECAAVPSIDRERLHTLIDIQELDPSFPPFVKFCTSNTIEIEIVSDGFDYYIDRILKRYNLEFLPVYANSLRIEDNKLIPAFPYLNPYCTRAANCKGTHVLNHAGDDQLRLIVGDGFSDRCAADYADIVFAKRKLIQYCRDVNISYEEYSDFTDVQNRIVDLLKRKRLNPRHRAEIRRCEAFRIEANV
jgi:2-hydroxy-3-keto-5-methylthiopentenyl-1-phosphate phosphatase